MAILMSREIPLISSIAELYGTRVIVGQKDSRDLELFANYAPPDFLQADDGVISLAYSLSQFPVDFFRSLNINTIKLAKHLNRRANKQYFQGNHAVSGVMDPINGRLYAVVDGLDEVIPHEVGHRILNKMDRKSFKQLKSQWKEVNDRYGLSYLGFDAAFNNPEVTSPKPGFVTHYSESAFTEDVPEVLSFLLSKPYVLMEITAEDKPIQEKTELVLSVLDRETQGLMGRAWKNHVSDGRHFPFISFWDARPEGLDRRLYSSLEAVIR
jgi:hypothetical protein